MSLFLARKSYWKQIIKSITLVLINVFLRMRFYVKTRLTLLLTFFSCFFKVYKKKTEAAKKEYLKQLAAYRASLVSKVTWVSVVIEFCRMKLWAGLEIKNSHYKVGFFNLVWCNVGLQISECQSSDCHNCQAAALLADCFDIFS